MKLFLLIGQSNMAGRGELSGQDQEPSTAEGIYSLAADLTWKPAVEPIHFDKPSMVGVGPGLTFAKTLAEKAGELHAPIGLIPCAVGGTRIERWIQGGDLYEQGLLRARAALSSGELCGILWAQGESDSNDLVCAETYKERFFSLIRDLRHDLSCEDVPFLAARLGTFILEQDYPYTGFIDEAIEQAGDHFGNYGWVASEGLEHKGDFLHYNADSAKELGRRFASKWISMSSSGK